MEKEELQGVSDLGTAFFVHLCGAVLFVTPQDKNTKKRSIHQFNKQSFKVLYCFSLEICISLKKCICFSLISRCIKNKMN